jgi:hypothetical protein
MVETRLFFEELLGSGERLRIVIRRSGWLFKSSGSQVLPTNPEAPVSSRQESVTEGPFQLYGTLRTWCVKENEIVSARASKELPGWLSGAIVAGVVVCLIGLKLLFGPEA